jgi:hypothetical protein
MRRTSKRPLPPSAKRLFYVNTVAAPVYLEILAKRPDIHTRRLTPRRSTNGAGFDAVNLNDATTAGVAVVNQAGGNKEGVAEHVMAMTHRRIGSRDAPWGRVPAAGFHGRRRSGSYERGFDVWEDEPPPPDHPLLQFDNVGQPAHSRDHPAIAAQHREDSSRAGARYSGRQEAATPAEPRGLGGLLRPIRSDFGVSSRGMRRTPRQKKIERPA